LLDGLSSPLTLAQRASQLGQSALAITDHGTMSGHIDFYKSCNKAGVRALLGLETYLAPLGIAARGAEARTNYHLTLLARNRTGYDNLINLSTIASLEGFYYKPRVDKEILAEHAQGLVVLSGCAQGELLYLLREGKDDEARQAAEWYARTFSENFYIELQRHAGMEDLGDAYERLVDIAHDMSLPLAATNDVHYARKRDARYQDILLAIQTKASYHDPDRMRMTDDSYYLKSEDEMRDLFPELPEALANTRWIANKCNVEIDFAPPYYIPKFDKSEKDSVVLLRELVYDGAHVLYDMSERKDVVERIEHELQIITEMGFADYFLIVHDFVREARERGMLWNVRGSGAGSMVLHCLGVVGVDPLEHGLIFERFLNPDRVNMPDVDFDFADDDRDEMLAYAVRRYGRENVSQIITFGSIGGKAAVRAVGRALDAPISLQDKTAKLIPQSTGKSLSVDESLKVSDELCKLRNSDKTVAEMLDFAAGIDGALSHASTHAAGVIIAEKPLTEYIPLRRPTSSKNAVIDRVSAWAMEDVDALGMLKVDFLGLRTLRQMREICHLVNERHGTELHPMHIPYDGDAKDVRGLYDLLASGETAGIFQVESEGMQEALQLIRPRNLDEVAAVIALYRPGPMKYIEPFARRSRGQEEITYRHPNLSDVLEDTYGIPVFQEQLMRISMLLAGFSGARADTMRKAISKKKEHMMDALRDEFIVGARENGIDAGLAQEIWDQDIEAFAEYGFNRSHATNYAEVTTRTAYLKSQYPLEFWAATLTVEQNNRDKLRSFLREAQKKFTVLPPCVNHSLQDFTIVDEQTIRMGLGGIKTLSSNAVATIIREREHNGPFTSVQDFLSRIPKSGANSGDVAVLIKCGALDELGERGAMLAYAQNTNRKKTRNVNQMSLFHVASEPLPPAPDIPQHKQARWEYEYLGFYIEEHPAERATQYLLATGQITNRFNVVRVENAGYSVKLMGVIESVRRHTTRKGHDMAFCSLTDGVTQIDVTVFPRTLQAIDALVLQEGQAVIVDGRVNDYNERASVVCNKMHGFDLGEVAGWESPKRESRVVGADVSREDAPYAFERCMQAPFGENVLSVEGRIVLQDVELTADLVETLEEKIPSLQIQTEAL